MEPSPELIRIELMDNTRLNLARSYGYVLKHVEKILIDLILNIIRFFGNVYHQILQYL